jgi:hypothetical protein
MALLPISLSATDKENTYVIHVCPPQFLCSVPFVPPMGKKEIHLHACCHVNLAGTSSNRQPNVDFMQYMLHLFLSCAEIPSTNLLTICIMQNDRLHPRKQQLTYVQPHICLYLGTNSSPSSTVSEDIQFSYLKSCNQICVFC